METKFNKLLYRQIKKHFGSVENLPLSMDNLMTDINNSYEYFDDDTQLLQNSIQISSQELRDAYQKHKHDAEILNETLFKIKKALNVSNSFHLPDVNHVDVTVADSNLLFDSLIKLIEDRKKVELALHEKEHFINSIAENSPNLIYLYNIADGRNIYTNRSISKTLGYSTEELSDEDPDFFKKIVHPDDLKQFDEFYKQIDFWKEDQFFEFEYRILTKTGSWRWFKGKEKEFQRENGKVTTMIGTIEDVTDKKIAEEALKESETRFRNVLQDIQSVSVQGYAPDGTTQYWNTASEHLYGYKAEEAIGKNLLDLIIPDEMKEPVKQAMKSISVTGEPIPSSELVLKRKDGSPITVYSSHTIIQIPGKSQELFCVDIDLTEQKNGEKELIIAKEKAEESDRLKSAFLANMSHEIRTPMNGILGFAELLKEPDLSGEQQQKYLRIIEKSGLRMLNIINDIVDISKIEAGQMEINITKVNINKKIEYLFNFFKPEAVNKGLQLFIGNMIPDEEAVIETDEEKLFAILSNLIKNAIKFTTTGFVSISCKLYRHNEPFISHTGISETKQDVIEFCVRDTGIGIPTERHIAIFDRFVQADIADTQAYQGAGLGLSIAKAFVEMLGGKIWLESEQGKGSSFYFNIPHKMITPNLILTTETEKKVELPEITKKLKILIVEDDETSVLLLNVLFRRFSREIIIVRTGIEALEIMHNQADIDLILMDIKLPGPDGLETTRQIRLFNDKVIIIAQTSFALIGDREMAISAGCSDYISKPINKTQLLQMVNKYVK
jgi:PAS domain S-box-containing protein